jgi:DNA-binding transcriptional ArsR family regulator
LARRGGALRETRDEARAKKLGELAPEETADDICELFSFDIEKVDRLRRDVAIITGLAGLFKALADDTRLKIVYALSREELCVCDVAGLIGASPQAASHHLRILRNLGLAQHRKEGKFVYYSLAGAHLARLIEEALTHKREAMAAGRA